MTHVGDRLREERERIGKGQEEFAEIGGVKRRTQIDYEMGRRPADTDYLARVAAAGVDVLYVITGRREVPVATTLTVQEEQLVENYRRAAETGRIAAETVLAALALQGKPQ